MKKSKFTLVLLVLLVSVTLLGVGYASWNQTNTIHNTVSTACFDVKLYDNAANVPSSPNTIAVGNIGNNGHSLTINITGLYPGAFTGVSKIIKNNSSIPVSINSANFKAVSNSNNVYNIDTDRILVHTVTITNYTNDSSSNPRVQQLITSPYVGLNAKLNSSPVQLAPGEACVFTYTVSWDDNSDLIDNKYQDQTLSFNYDLGYTQ